MSRTGRRHVLLPIALAGLALAAMASPTTSSPASGKTIDGVVLGGKGRAEDDDLWWKHAVVYQIYPRSFKDSNGDGLGDIKGITSELEHLKDIGVGAVWLSPFYPSPQKDFGYDISNFTDVDPNYGTLEDFKEMVDKSHNLGMKVVVDLVPNHSSDQHEWFKLSEQGDPKYKDYYVWNEGKLLENGTRIPPNNWVSHFRFAAWKWSDLRQAYYLHQFVEEQPDLNYYNPAVVQEMKDVFTFWMKHGVDGFRVDALPFLFETQNFEDEPVNDNRDPDLTPDDYDYYTHPYTMDYPQTYDMVAQWRKLVDEFDENPRVIMTECYTSFDKTIEYYGTKEKPGAHFTFNFLFVNGVDESSVAADYKKNIDRWMVAMDDWRWPNWVTGNHDNKRVATRFPEMADAFNMISLTLPGTAMTYYGEEIGMTDTFIRWDQTKDPQGRNAGKQNYLKVSRDPCRTPMQWDDTKNAGFSTNDTTWMPTNPNFVECNVKKEKDIPKSHMNVYKALTEARKTATMRTKNVDTQVLDDDVLMIKRTLDGHETFITVVNLGSWEKSIASERLDSKSLEVYAAGQKSRLSKGDAVKSTLVLRQKEGIVLTWASSRSGADIMRASILMSTVVSILSLQW